MGLRGGTCAEPNLRLKAVGREQREQGGTERSPIPHSISTALTLPMGERSLGASRGARGLLCHPALALKEKYNISPSVTACPGTCHQVFVATRSLPGCWL